jgi:hypothetical protein
MLATNSIVQRSFARSKTSRIRLLIKSLAAAGLFRVRAALRAQGGLPMVTRSLFSQALPAESLAQEPTWLG